MAKGAIELEIKGLAILEEMDKTRINICTADCIRKNNGFRCNMKNVDLGRDGKCVFFKSEYKDEKTPNSL